MRTLIQKADLFSPAFNLHPGNILTVQPGTLVAGLDLEETVKPVEALTPGNDYAIAVVDGIAMVSALAGAPSQSFIGGFHVGFDGNIVPASIWDANFRPKCPDPRGMVLVSNFWADIYLLNIDPHLYGTSSAGKEIADGASQIEMPQGGRQPLTWWNAVTVLSSHGKQLLSLAEFSLAASGTEDGKNNDGDPKTTGRSPGLRSAVGLEQATGCMWTWGRDSEPSSPYVAVFGGGWLSARSGSRRCCTDDPGSYWYGLGARGRCDHLILG